MWGRGKRKDQSNNDELNSTGQQNGEPLAESFDGQDESQDRSNRWRALLLAGVVIDLLLVGYAIYLLWNNTNSSAPTTVVVPPTTPTQERVELWNAYGEALLAARGQAEDATLVSASTQWQGVNEETLLSGAQNWSFVFYSPARNHSFDIVVNGTKAQIVNDVQLRVPPRAIPMGDWRAGPSDALLVFLAYSGRTFLDEHPQSVVNLHLGKNDAGQTVWSIVALDPQDQSVYSLLVDTETMQVLSSSA